MDCRHENDPHDHGHGHSHGGDGHDHSDHLPPPDTFDAQTLYPHIDHDKIVTLNERVPGAGARIVRKYSDRLETDPLLESDVDEELLITIPFTGVVRLHSVLIRSPADDRAPDEIRLIRNRDDLDFTSAHDTLAAQTLEHPAGVGIGTADNDGIVEYAVNRAKFSNTSSLTFYIASNHGADTTALSYIGLRGDWQELSRAPVVAVYEAAANPKDHKTSATDHVQETV